MLIPNIVPSPLSLTGGAIIIICAIASRTDMNSHIIPDKLTLPGIGIGLLLGCMNSLLLQVFMPVLLSLAGLFAGTLFGIILVQIKFWSGGDAKLLMAIITIIGLQVYSISYTFHLIIWIGIISLAHRLYKKGEAPLAPAFLLAYLSSILLQL